MRATLRDASFFLLLALSPWTRAHEIETNRLSVVLRDDNHISISYFIDYPDALHRILAPALPFPEFIVMFSAMAPTEFQKAITRAHQRIQSETKLALPSGSVPITGWKWPSAEGARGLLRERAMAAIVAPQEHTHASPLEIRAEAIAPHRVDALDVSLPSELQDVVIVSYRPKQTFARAGTKTVRVRF